MKLKKYLTAMKSTTLYICLLIVSSLAYVGCTNVLNPEDFSGDGQAKITITSPLSNDTVWHQSHVIQYEVEQVEGINYIELHVNDKFQRNFPANADGSKPELTFNFDSTDIGKSFSYQLVYFDLDESFAATDVKTNLHIVESKSLPSKPFGLKLQKLSNKTLNISWQDNSTQVVLTGYEIWRKIGFEGDYIKHLIAAPKTFNINDENLSDTLIYFYKIRAVNKWGGSDFSEPVNTIGTGGSGSIIPPTELVAKESMTNTRVVRLQWKDNSNNENYFGIERRYTFGEFENIGYVNRNATEFLDSLNGLLAGTEYNYRVKAYSGNDSAWSNEAFVRTLPYIFKSPTDLSATNPSSKEILLKWKDNEPYNTFTIIERKAGINGTYEEIASVGGQMTTYADTSIIPAKTYYYRVLATDGIVNSGYSNEINIYANIISLPAPTSLTATYFAGNIMELRWNFNAVATKFYIERRNVSINGSFEVIAEVEGTVRVFQDIGTECQTNYVYRVKATDGIVNSSYSNERSVSNTSDCP